MAIKPSLRFAVLLLLFHYIVAAAVYLTAMPLASRLAILMMILLSLFYYLARDVLLLLSNSWCEILPDQNGVSIIVRNGSATHGHIADKAVVSPFFILLRVKLEGYSMPVSRVIFPDALDAGLFRGLCVHLKFALPPV